MYVCVCMYVCMCVCMYVCVYVWMYVCMNVCVCMYVCMYVCMCMYFCICYGFHWCIHIRVPQLESATCQRKTLLLHDVCQEKPSREKLWAPAFRLSGFWGTKCPSGFPFWGPKWVPKWGRRCMQKRGAFCRHFLALIVSTFWPSLKGFLWSWGFLEGLFRSFWVSQACSLDGAHPLLEPGSVF